MSNHGLDLAERFYRAYGEPMLQENFSTILDSLAVGLIGSGSECLGYDDELSRDHDFEVGFCLFLPNETRIDRKTEFALERAYAGLPKEFEGIPRLPLSPVGGNRHGVLRTADFLKQKIGRADGALSPMEWFFVPEQSLLELTSGRIFYDGCGEISAARERCAYLPEAVRRKKLAGELLLAAQSGQYNYPRCLARGEEGAAQLSLGEFVKSAMHCIFLLNRRYLPYYKWSFRALRELPKLADCEEALVELLSHPNDAQNASRKARQIEAIAEKLAAELRAQELSERADGELEAHAYAVNDRICDETIRNLHILYAI